MIIVIATIQLNPGTRDSFLQEFHRIVPDVLQEQGCIEYGPTVDAATPIANQNVDENRVTIVEKWADVESLSAHLQAPHMLEYRPKVKDFVASSELRVLESA
jgi:quinol monooxygenase YgiN